MVKVVRRGMKVFLNKDYLVGENYDRREFTSHNARAKGKVITVRDFSSTIFDTPDNYGVFAYEWVDELSEVSTDNLITAVIMGGLSEEEYETIRRERG